MARRSKDGVRYILNICFLFQHAQIKIDIDKFLANFETKNELPEIYQY